MQPLSQPLPRQEGRVTLFALLLIVLRPRCRTGCGAPMPKFRWRSSCLPYSRCRSMRFGQGPLHGQFLCRLVFTDVPLDSSVYPGLYLRLLLPLAAKKQTATCGLACAGKYSQLKDRILSSLGWARTLAPSQIIPKQTARKLIDRIANGSSSCCGMPLLSATRPEDNELARTPRSRNLRFSGTPQALCSRAEWRPHLL